MADLTTLANVKAWLSIQTSGDDAVLARIITSVSAYVQTWLNRRILSENYSEVRAGTGTQYLALANYPINSIVSLTVNGKSIAASPDGMQFGYVLAGSNTLQLVGSVFPAGAGNVRVSYNAGYATVPPELEQATIELIALRFRERTRVGEVSKSIGGETISYSQKDFPDGVRTILNNYRKVVSV